MIVLLVQIEAERKADREQDSTEKKVIWFSFRYLILLTGSKKNLFLSHFENTI